MIKTKQVEVVRDGNVHSVRWIRVDLDVGVGSTLIDKLDRKWTVVEDYPELEWTPPRKMQRIVKNAWRVNGSHS